MLDHIVIYVSDLTRSVAFYDKALAPLGYKKLMDFPGGSGYGASRPQFWLGSGKPPEEMHVAFKAKDAKEVQAFHAAAMAAGARDNGKPGPRKEYHPGYYGAFVLDPDGYNVEACCHDHKG